MQLAITITIDSEQFSAAPVAQAEVTRPEVLPFVAPPAEEPPPPAITLTEAYDRWLLNRDIKPATQSDDQTSLSKARGLLGDVQLAEVGPEQFEAILASTLTRSRQDKVLMTLGKVLRWAAEQGLIEKAPPVPRHKQPRKRRFAEVVSTADAESLYAACDVAQWPQMGSLAPAFVWRTWILMHWVYGARTQDFVGYKTKAANGLLWASVCFERDCPWAMQHQWQHGWLRYVSSKTGEEVILPIHSLVRARLERFVGLDEVRVFPNGRSKGGRAPDGTVRQWGFLTQWQEICAAAGVSPRVSVAGSGRPSLRKSCNQMWQRLHSGLGEYVLGHAVNGVNAKHYDDMLGHVVAHIEDLPIPNGMRQ